MTEGPIPVRSIGYAGPGAALPEGMGFTAEHLAAITEARKRFGAIRREIGVATFDAWSVAVFAGLTVAFGWSSPPALCVGLAMAGVAVVEFWGIKRVEALDERGPRVLGWNQFFFGGVLIAYAVYNLMMPGAGVSAEVKELAAVDPQFAGMVSSMMESVHKIVYAVLIAVAVIFQGGCGVYHLRRAGVVRRYREETPQWILQLHETGIMR